MVTLSSALLCLTMAVYHESRSESVYDQYRVAQTIMHRTRQRDKTVCEVVKERKQFSWVVNGKGKKPKESDAWFKAVEVASNTLYSNKVVNSKKVPDHFWSVEADGLHEWQNDCKWKERRRKLTFCQIYARAD